MNEKLLDLNLKFPEPAARAIVSLCEKASGAIDQASANSLRFFWWDGFWSGLVLSAWVFLLVLLATVISKK